MPPTRLPELIYVVEDELAIARIISKLNQASAGKTVLLLGPGRWGTRDPWLGIPVNFAEINHVAALCEIVAMHESLIPDVSLGTHFINELVEADMLYFALFPQQDANRIDEARLLSLPNRLTALIPDAARWAEVIHLAEPPAGSLALYADAESQSVVLTADL